MGIGSWEGKRFCYNKNKKMIFVFAWIQRAGKMNKKGKKGRSYRNENKYEGKKRRGAM